MKLGITGRPNAGRTTVFEALTRSFSGSGDKSEDRIGTVPVPDERVDILSEMYRPQKTIHAQVEYFLPGIPPGKETRKDPEAWRGVRDCDALIHVVRNFRGYGMEPPDPLGDFKALDEELILSDLMSVEKRLERLDLDRKRGKAGDETERSLLEQCRDLLNAETPLRRSPELADAPALRGFAFLSAKPMLALFNNEDDDDALPAGAEDLDDDLTGVIRAKLEHELAQMDAEEAEAFLEEFAITASATHRVILASYELLGLISFFTVGDDEVRAWTIRRGTSALDAAGTIHTDLKKGFIRAEVISYDDLIAAGTYAEGRKRGTVRLEGKTYEVQDGDVITVRFNV